MFSRFEVIGNMLLGIVILFTREFLATLGLASRIVPLPEPKDNLTNKVAIVTGANTGIGKSTAFKLACFGATVILACRDPKRGQEAADDINAKLKEVDRSEYPHASKGQAIFMKMDLNDLSSVLAFSKQFQEKYTRLDILVNNAGLSAVQILSNGVEQLFQANYLGHYLLLRSLISLLRTPIAGVTDAARVINLSSVMHHLGVPDFKKSAIGRRKKKAYGDSKFYMNLLTMEINHRYNSLLADKASNLQKSATPSRPVVSICVNPGAVRSDIWRNVPFKELFYKITKLLFIEVDEGAATSIHAAVMPEKELIEYQKTHSWSGDAVGKFCLRGDCPYLIPYYMPSDLLAYETMAPFAGSRIGKITMHYPNPGSPKNDDDLNTYFTSPVDLSKQFWQFSNELSRKVLADTKVPDKEFAFLA